MGRSHRLGGNSRHGNEVVMYKRKGGYSRPAMNKGYGTKKSKGYGKKKKGK